MNYPNYGYNRQGYPYSYNNYYQKQEYLSKQKVSLVQDQKSSNTIMCRILSELENLAIMLLYPGQRIFGYYATMPSSHKEIINQIIIQMKIFESSYRNFMKTNPGKEYIFPNNLQGKDIERIVNNWKEYLIQKAKTTRQAQYENAIKYYDEFLNILYNGRLSMSFNSEFANLGNDSPPLSQNDLRRVMNAGTTAVCFMNEAHNNIEEEIARKGDCKVNVVLNGNRSDNKFYNYTDRFDQEVNNYKKELYSYLLPMLGYLEKYAMLNVNTNRTIIPKYSQHTKPTINTEKKVLDEYLKYFDKFYQIYMSPKADYDLEPKDLQNFIKDINSWKNNLTNVKARKEMENAIDLLKRNNDNIL